MHLSKSSTLQQWFPCRIYSNVSLYSHVRTKAASAIRSPLWIFAFVFLVFICCQLQLATGSSDNQDTDDIDLGDDLYEALPIQHHQLLHHQDFRRASLRYHPHILYKKASLRPIIGQNGKISFSKRDRVRRSLSSSVDYEWTKTSIFISCMFSFSNENSVRELAGVLAPPLRTANNQ